MVALLLVLVVSLVARVAAGRPGAFEPNDAWITYKTSGWTAERAEGGGLEHTARITLSRDQQPQHGVGFKELRATVQPQTAQRLSIRVAPEGQQRWQVPESIVPRPAAVRGLSASSLLYELQQPHASAAVAAAATPTQPFALTVSRKTTGRPVLDTRGHPFLFKDQLIELTTNVPADSDLYGLGEVTLPGGLLLPRDGNVVAMWARDSAASEPTINVYGAHPFLLQVNKDGTAHGLVFLNSNGMDVILNKTSVTFRAIGGLVELYVFLGPTPEEVIRQYHEVVGAPAMPPFWALGAQQGKWGYPNIETLEQVVANYTAAGLPLEGLWVDIELYNDRFQVFTFDKDRFPAQRMRAFADKLHAAGRHWAPIFNPGIATMPGYRAFEEGNAGGIWIEDVNGNPYRGQVWPGSVYYPSYLSPNTGAWLQRQMQSMHDQVPFDGMWLDMTEAANFCTGMVCELPNANKTKMWALELPTPLDFNVTQTRLLRTTCQLACTEAPASNRLAQPPYAIHNFGWKASASNNDVLVQEVDGNRTERLDLKAISVTARHPDGTSEYDAHNLYGTAMAKQFATAYKAISKKRLFLLTRSTFPGAGRYTGHWTGDTRVSWRSLQDATGSILAANMWGLAMTGADICGYGIEGPALNMTDAQLQELCTRWISAGAFYPLSRNHMNYFTIPHEPYRWASTTAAAKKAYGLRYRLLTYLYSSMFLVHTKGGTLARPLLFTDPRDLKARNATQQWMLGEALLVSPVVSNDSSTFRPYFTAGAWYSAWDYRRLDSSGSTIRMDVPLGDIAVHYRGGAVVPLQRYAALTRDVRRSPVTLLVTLPAAPAHSAVVSAAEQDKGPLYPYALDAPCAQAHARHAGKLVSCGLLYADDDAQDVSDATSTQVWLHAVTEPDAQSGTLASVIKAADPAQEGKLRVTEVHVAGLHVQQQQQGRGPAAVNPRKAQEASTGLGPLTYVSSHGQRAGQSRVVKATYDKDSKGVLRITGLDLPADVPFTIKWQL